MPGLMFMFRSKRTTLIKRLLKVARGGKKQDAGGGGGGGDSASAAVMGLLRRLQDNQLEMLWAAVESGGRDPANNCVLLPRELQPHVLCCQTFRWPADHLHSGSLRRLPACRSACDPVYVCCNPYHWSRVFQPGKSASQQPPPNSTNECNKFVAVVRGGGGVFTNYSAL